MNPRVFLFWSVFSAAAGMRLLSSLYAHPPDIGDCLKAPVAGQGIISEDPSFTDGGQVLVVQESAMGSACPSGLLIRMKTKLYPRFHFGDEVSFSGKLSAPFNFKGGTGRSFDYQGYLAKDDIYYEMKSARVSAKEASTQKESGQGASKKAQGASEFVTSILYKLKRGFVSNLEHALGEPHAALAAGLVVGEKSALGKDLLADFRTVGLIHVVVLSGFNITIVADAMRRLLSRLPRAWGIAVGGCGIVLFGMLVGGGATVVRSCFMALVALSADVIRRDYDVVRALAFAALLMLIQNPSILLHDPSFQLSFLATLGLILLASPVEKKLTFVTEKFGMRGIVAATLSTQIFVSPYILYMMGQLSIIGTLVNILVLPFIPVTMLMVFLTGAIGFISPWLAHIIGWGSHILLSYELFMVEHFARVPFAAITIPPFSGWWVVGFYVVFTAVFIWVKRKQSKEKV